MNLFQYQMKAAEYDFDRILKIFLTQFGLKHQFKFFSSLFRANPATRLDVLSPHPDHCGHWAWNRLSCSYSSSPHKIYSFLLRTHRLPRAPRGWISWNLIVHTGTNGGVYGRVVKFK